MLASLVFDAVLSVPPDKRVKPISVLCTDTRVEIPAIVDMVAGTLDKMRRCSKQHGLGVDVNLLRPPLSRQKGIVMSDWKETNRLREIQEEVAAEKGTSADTLRRLLAKVDEYSESHRAFGLPDDLLNILRDDLEYEMASNLKQ